MADRKDINPRRPIPSTQYDKLRDNLSAGFNKGFPVEKFPLQDNRPSINKGDHISRKDDTIQDISIGLQDHDEAIDYYFNNVIKPSVIINNNRTNVPIIYGSPERWKSVQKDGYYRDKDYAISTETTSHGESFSIIISTHLSRVEKLNLIPLRGGKYPTTTKLDGGTANTSE